MRSRETSEDSSSSGREWLTTFGDMVTLLLTFFVLVYSFCSYTPGEWETAVGSIKGALSVIPGTKGDKLLPGSSSGRLPGHMGVVPLFAEMSSLEEARHRAFDEELGKIREQIAGTEGIQIKETETGFVFSIATPLLFERGSADTKSSAEPLLEAIARATHTAEVSLIVTGHTCDLPISTLEFRSNWELSARRATNVLRMIETKASDKTKFVAVGRGQYAPLAANENDESRARNRRVEIELDIRGGFPFES